MSAPPTAPSAPSTPRARRAPAVTATARRPGLDVERTLWRAGHRWVAGIDEVGRGAWAGPLSVGVAIVGPAGRADRVPPGLRDSKAIAEVRREAVFAEVAAWCADAAVGHATPEECDRLGMTRAWRLAAFRALARLEIVPDAAVIDGPHDLLRGPGAGVPGTPGPRPEDAPGAVRAGGPEPGEAGAGVRVPETVLALVGADATSASVAAASVLAKVVRDRAMRAEAEHFPPYGFDRNKGYPSARHQIALRGYGLSSIHRRSWSYVTELPWR